MALDVKDPEKHLSLDGLGLGGQHLTVRPGVKILVWAAVVVLFFSGSQSKRPGYILPAIIALAVLTARLFDHALTHPDGRAARLALRGALGVALFSAAAAGALSLNLLEPGRLQALLRFESNEFARLQPALGTIVLSLLGMTAAALAVQLRRDVRLTLPVFVLPSVLFLTIGFGVAERYADASSARRLARALPALPAGTVVACLECFSVGLPFYLGRPVVYITQNEDGLTSNYVRYALRRGRRWPTVLVHLDERDSVAGGPGSARLPPGPPAHARVTRRHRGPPRARRARGAPPLVGRPGAALRQALGCVASAASPSPVERWTPPARAVTSTR